eukprot:TRINITY_DN9503_c0_g9_i1.p1 TRINITY_DN9503_c0_g9~~TRINITY_DN9503_c0_g9_i1.p1  ORF type:complete len:404 (-),score=59.25 TRINITY_DN9503_c0_g9_i1:73-1251(-)
MDMEALTFAFPKPSQATSNVPVAPLQSIGCQQQRSSWRELGSQAAIPVVAALSLGLYTQFRRSSRQHFGRKRKRLIANRLSSVTSTRAFLPAFSGIRIPTPLDDVPWSESLTNFAGPDEAGIAFGVGASFVVYFILTFEEVWLGFANRLAFLLPEGSRAWPEGYVGQARPDEVLKSIEWPKEWPYSAQDMSRADESDDQDFYSEPKLTTHIDDGAINDLKKFYAKEFPKFPDARILDICSSWISHYPDKKTWSHVSITGMNLKELEMNKQADDYKVADLNKDPQLPYEDGSFDIVTCTVSFDYLTKPLEVMKEVGRVLKPGGRVILSTSNRCFPTKAVSVWLRTKDTGHILIYGSYMHYSGLFEAPECKDLSSNMAKAGFMDPMYVVSAKKK